METINNLSILIANNQGFALNTNIFETNIINLAILISALVYFGKQPIANILSNRQEKVFFALQEAETKLEQANTRISDAQKQLEQTKLVIQQIEKEAEVAANKIKDSILSQGKIDVERLAASSKANILSTEIAIRRQIQQQIITLALKRVALQLKGQMNKETQERIINTNIAELGGKV
uniref:ATP synthase CFO B subunit subunit I n=1 Tax=Erythrolobus coxiae TaxID=362235 RepID=UPI001FCDEA75|nr:ATP synthase CFO B subunit subunit I [Erythrolobus coxiae]UNJ17662.1 ATP synthase CFO B subunit subunit I [Erythrolobus coxiae]